MNIEVGRETIPLVRQEVFQPVREVVYRPSRFRTFDWPRWWSFHRARRRIIYRPDSILFQHPTQGGLPEVSQRKRLRMGIWNSKRGVDVIGPVLETERLFAEVDNF